MVNLFVDSIPVNNQNKNGNTPLHIAFLKENMPFVKLLLKKGADLQKQNNDKLNPFGLAIVNNKLEIVRECLEQNIINSSNPLECQHILKKNNPITKEMINLLTTYFPDF